MSDDGLEDMTGGCLLGLLEGACETDSGWVVIVVLAIIAAVLIGGHVWLGWFW